jgi:hypothetical protein
LPIPLEAAAASATNPNPDAPSLFEQQVPSPEATDVTTPAEALVEVPNPDVAPSPQAMSADPTGLRDLADLTNARLKAPAAQKPGLTPEQLRILEQDHDRVSAQAEQLATQRQQLTVEADKRYMESRARALSFRSSGAEDGVVRRLDLRGVPQEKLERVLNRHGITMREMRIEAPVLNRSPLSSVETDAGEYHTQEMVAPGYYEVFQMSDMTFATIARLENEFMRRHRLDPLKTKWVSVTFSVQYVGGTLGYDLVITDAEYERIE